MGFPKGFEDNFLLSYSLLKVFWSIIWRLLQEKISIIYHWEQIVILSLFFRHYPFLSNQKHLAQSFVKLANVWRAAIGSNRILAYLSSRLLHQDCFLQQLPMVCILEKIIISHGNIWCRITKMYLFGEIPSIHRWH